MPDLYMKIDGIEGEATDEKHVKEIQILSYSHGLSMPMVGDASGGGSRASGKAVFQDFSFSKYLDKSSAHINLACCQGTHFKTIKLTCYRADDKGRVAYLVYDFEDSMVTSVSIGGSGGDMPVESISFTYAKVKWTYSVSDTKTGEAKGQDPTGWDLHTNKKV